MKVRNTSYLHHRVRLGETLEAFHQLGQLRRVLALDSHSHDRADRELHHFHVVGLLEGGDGSSLDQVLVNAHETADVAAGHVLDGLCVATHHQDSSGWRKHSKHLIHWHKQSKKDTFRLRVYSASNIHANTCENEILVLVRSPLIPLVNMRLNRCYEVLDVGLPLDGLLVQVLLLARGEVGPHDAHLLASADSSGEHTAKSVETSLVAGGYHLGNVHHQLSLGVAGLDA